MLILNYLKCCLKRNSKFFPAALIFSLIITVLLAGMFFAFFGTQDEVVEFNSNVSIGIVANNEDKYLKMGIDAIETLDTTSSYLTLVYYDDEESAINDMKSETIMGYLLIPDDYVRSVLRGDNITATFVSNNSIIDMAPMIVNDVIDTVSDLVFESQVGIFAMEEFYDEYNVKGYKQAISDINVKYISFVIDRSNMVKVTEIKEYKQNSLQGYFACVFFVIIVILVGVLSAAICIKKDLSLTRLLDSRGCNALCQTFIDFLCFCIMPLLILLLIFVCMVVFFNIKTCIIPEFSDLTLYGYFDMFIKMIPGVLAVCSLQFLVYEFCNDIITGSLLQFVTSMGLAYISGCIYPISFFPEKIQNAVKYTPFGAAIESFKQISLDILDVKNIYLCAGYCLVFVLLSSLVRMIKIRSRAV